MPHSIRLDDGFTLDYSLLMQDAIGVTGLTEQMILDCDGATPALLAMEVMRRTGEVRGHNEKVLFSRLPYQEGANGEHLEKILAWGKAVRERFTHVVFLGIGGSWLGNQVLADALLPAYWNERNIQRSTPRIFFSGNNVDPASASALAEVLDLPRTMFVVISKSGTTTETMAAFLYFYHLCLERGVDPVGRFTAITDPEKGILRRMANEQGWPAFHVPDGVGGRWSVLTDVGLLLGAVLGIDVRRLLAGARAMDQACHARNVLENPAALYAIACHLLDKDKGICESVIMPYCDGLRSLALWYVQLLAESLGKEKNRQGHVVHEGRTPIAAVGTSDMHAQTQQHREGRRNKLVTTIAVADFGNREIVLPEVGEFTEHLPFVAGRKFSELLDAARRANEASLAADGRPSCSITIPKLDAYTLGQLFQFFEMATAIEGELLDVNAFDQPGVEHYKKIMKELLSGS